MTWHIRADRGVIHYRDVGYGQLIQAQSQIASILNVETGKGRRFEFDREGRVVVYDGRQYIDALWIVDGSEQYAPLGL
jgi:hypothetical protein